MPRKTFIEEQKAREVISDLLARDVLVSNYKTFYPPFQAVKILEQHGVKVSRDYVTDRYNEAGIENQNGLWIMKSKVIE